MPVWRIEILDFRALLWLWEVRAWRFEFGFRA